MGEMTSRSLLPFSGPLHLSWRWPEHEKPRSFTAPSGTAAGVRSNDLDYPAAALVSIGGISPQQAPGLRLCGLRVAPARSRDIRLDDRPYPGWLRRFHPPSRSA